MAAVKLTNHNLKAKTLCYRFALHPNSHPITIQWALRQVPKQTKTYHLKNIRVYDSCGLYTINSTPSNAHKNKQTYIFLLNSNPRKGRICEISKLFNTPKK